MFPSPVDTMLLDLGNQLAPFAAGCVIFAGVVLVGMFAAMIADIRIRRPAATPPIAVPGASRPLAA
jgi:hypothetical protein